MVEVNTDNQLGQASPSSRPVSTLSQQHQCSNIDPSFPSPSRQSSPLSAASSQPILTASHALLWSKSKVYVHPSPYAKHNIPGYLALVRQGPAQPGATVLLSFLPESLIEERHELEKFVLIEYTTSAGGDDDNDDDDDDETGPSKNLVAVEDDDHESVLIAEPPASASYAFSLPLTSIYSFTIKSPTISCWYGSVTISQVGGVALPTLHFHDDESKSTVLSLHRAKTATVWNSSSQLSNSFDSRSLARSSSPIPTWGGDELVQQLRRYANVHKSAIDPSLFLVNPSRTDLEIHTTPMFDDDAIDPPSKLTSSSSVPATSSGWGANEYLQDHFSMSPLHQSLAGNNSPRRSDAAIDNFTLWAKNTKLSVLSSFATLTQQARHASHAVLSHPLAKPYVPHLPGPVQSFAHAGPIPLGPNDGEWEWRKSSIANNSGTSEYYDSARVYLAKWARLVAEEGERNRRKEERLGIGSSQLPTSASTLAATNENPSGVQEGSELGAFEVLEKVYDLPRPISEREAQQQQMLTSLDDRAVEDAPGGLSTCMDLQEWQSLFDQETGSPLHSVKDIRHRIFVNGLTNEARREAWPFLLGVVSFESTFSEREELWNKRQVDYFTIKARWQTNQELLNSDAIKEQQHRIRVDCLRTDRGQPMFAAKRKPQANDQASQGGDDSSAQPHRRPSLDQEDNPHIVKLGEILLTYGFWESEQEKTSKACDQSDDSTNNDKHDEENGLAGYVQGMSDLCSPLYVISGGDEVTTFWCFVGFMERVKSNFNRDQSGMKTQLLLLQKLIRIMDPKLYSHLERTDSLNLFFCFRWLLVCFKREFSFSETLTIWETCWSSETILTDNFYIWIALSILEIHRQVLLRYLEHFDEILQYVNSLSQINGKGRAEEEREEALSKIKSSTSGSRNGGMDVDQVLNKAEVLAKSFRELVHHIQQKPQPTQQDLEITEIEKEIQNLSDFELGRMMVL